MTFVVRVKYLHFSLSFSFKVYFNEWTTVDVSEEVTLNKGVALPYVQTLFFFCWGSEPKYSTVLFLHKILVCDLKCGGCTRLTCVSCCWESALYPHRIINIDLYSWCCVSSWIIKFIYTLNAVQLPSSLWRQGWFWRILVLVLISLVAVEHGWTGVT
jgi:hypothetical protein